MYKLIICNLGYENIFLSELDGKEYDTVEGLLEDLEGNLSCDDTESLKEIDGYKITYKNFDVDREFDSDNTSNIILTEDSNRSIYIIEI